MVPNIEYDYLLLLGIYGIYIRNTILLGSTTERTLLIWVRIGVI